MNYPKVSIIILNWNGFEDTAECLESLKKIAYPNCQIVIVDQGSQENEADRLEKRFGDFIKVIRNKKNLGFPEGCNIGIRYALKKESDYIFLLNNDTVVEPNFLEPLVEVMEKDRKIGAVQPKIHYFYQKDYFDYAGAAGGMIDIFGYPFTRGRVFYTNEKDKGQYDDISPIFWASGAATLIGREVFEKVGFLDPSYFAYFDETDLSWRMWVNGFSIFSVPSSIIYHKVAAATKRHLFKKSYWEHRNNIIMLLKNYALPDLFLLLPIRLILDIVNLFYYLFTFRFKKFLALLAAQAWLITHFPFVLAQRKSKHLRMTKLPIYKGSIVWKYFVCGKKSYREIIKT